MLPDYMADEAYRQAEGLNWSLLKHMAKSPKHYRHAQVVPRVDTAAFRLGRAVHAAILEPERFQRDWTVYYGRRAGSKWHDFCAANEGLEILVEREYEQAQLMGDIVRAAPETAGRLAQGWAERSIFWEEECPVSAELVKMKARLDWVYRDGDEWVLVDVKTARDITARGFGSAAGRYLYHGQVAHYLEALKSVIPADAPVRAELLVVETEAPHDCGIYKLDAAALECGYLRRTALLSRLGHCNMTDYWPGLLAHPEWLQLPEWELAILDDADVMGG